MKKLISLTVGLALAALAMGCDNTSNSNNTNNGNRPAANANNANTAHANANNSNRAGAPTREEYEKNKESYGKQAKEAGSKIGAGAEDLWLWLKVRTALAGVDDLRDTTINVDVNNSAVTLRGTVASPDQVKKADAAAKGVEGVKSVSNQLKVGAAAGGNANNSNAKPKK
jgi:osmotically-inducible protein OsmY